MRSKLLGVLAAWVGQNPSNVMGLCHPCSLRKYKRACFATSCVCIVTSITGSASAAPVMISRVTSSLGQDCAHNIACSHCYVSMFSVLVVLHQIHTSVVTNQIHTSVVPNLPLCPVMCVSVMYWH